MRHVFSDRYCLCWLTDFKPDADVSRLTGGH